MRLLYPLLLLVILAFVVITIVTSKSGADPKETALGFLNAVKSGDYKGTVEMFGGNTCRCPKKGGWVSYLVYASAQEPNLSFLMGKPFAFRDLKATPIKHPDKDHVTILPWQQPEDVVVETEITFDETRYMPMFLPLDMAYGIPMTEDQFNSFLKDPDKECYKAFTLRLRPSLAPGAIERPEASKGIEYKPTEKAHDINEQGSVSIEDKQKQILIRTPEGVKTLTAKKTTETKPKNEEDDEESDDSFIYASVEDAIRETLGEEVAAYLHPKDAGPVKRKDGTVIPVEEIEKVLPRLKSSRLRLHVVRREQLKKWTVYHVALIEPNLKLSDGTTCVLKSYKAPSQEAVPEPEPKNEN